MLYGRVHEKSLQQTKNSNKPAPLTDQLSQPDTGEFTNNFDCLVHGVLFGAGLLNFAILIGHLREPAPTDITRLLLLLLNPPPLTDQPQQPNAVRAGSRKISPANKKFK